MKQLWADGKPVINGWTAMPGTPTVEIMACAGWAKMNSAFFFPELQGANGWTSGKGDGVYIAPHGLERAATCSFQ